MLRRPNSKDEARKQPGQWRGDDDDGKNIHKFRGRRSRVWKVQVTTFLCIIAVLLLADSYLHVDLEGTTGSSKLLARNSTNPSPPQRRQRTLPQWAKDPELTPIAKILQLARYDLNDTKVFDNETIESLPKWSHVNEQFGPEPKIFGMESCSTFQQATASQAYYRRIAVAGTFNSGTNLLSELLRSNCYIKERVEKRGLPNTGMEWQGMKADIYAVQRRRVHCM